jgi:hypothetical protein
MSRAGNKGPRCYVCGVDNPAGLLVRSKGSRACYTARADHAEWDGVLHGGENEAEFYKTRELRWFTVRSWRFEK